MKNFRFGILSLFVFLGTSIGLAVEKPKIQKYTIYVEGRKKAGEQVVQRFSDGLIKVNFIFKDNGRGPEITEEIKLNKQGFPTSYTVKGQSTLGNSVNEQYQYSNGKATWSSPVEKGEVVTKAPLYYAPLNGSLEIPSLMLGWSRRQKTQFISHIKPFWEIIRHRMPEMVFQDLQKDLDSNLVKIISGRLGEIKKIDNQWQVAYKDRKTGKSITSMFDNVIMASGSQVDQSLLKNNDVPGISVCEFGFGYNSIKDLHLKIWLAGPASKSNHWEITAIPEISVQAAHITNELALNVGMLEMPASPIPKF